MIEMRAASEKLPDWIVSQIGARESYSAARVFDAQHRLTRLYTDFWCRFGADWLRRGNSSMRSLAERRHPAVPSNKVVSFNAGTIYRTIRNSHRKARDAASVFESFLRFGQWFDDKVTSQLQRLPLSERIAFFSYNTGCLRSIRHLRSRGAKTFVDQIDPGKTEYQLVMDEAVRWSGWVDQTPQISDAYVDRLAAEWDSADAVIVNSSWSAGALVSQGVPPEKVHVVPLAYEPRSAFPPRNEPSRNQPLRVLWMGSVILRKGIPYLLDAARLLLHRSIRFTIVGEIGISQQGVAYAPPNVEFKGRVTRDQTDAFYQSSDVFAFPTLSDGFGLVQLEAMAHGLPVISTPNCGAIVENGVDGFVTPPRDSAALANAIAALDDDRPRLGAMGRAAIQKSRAFSLEAFGSKLDAIAASLFQDS